MIGCTFLSLFLVKMAWMGADTLEEGPVHEEAGLLIRVPPSFNVLPSCDAMIDVCMLARNLTVQKLIDRSGNELHECDGKRGHLMSPHKIISLD